MSPKTEKALARSPDSVFWSHQSAEHDALLQIFMSLVHPAPRNLIQEAQRQHDEWIQIRNGLAGGQNKQQYLKWKSAFDQQAKRSLKFFDVVKRQVNIPEMGDLFKAVVDHMILETKNMVRIADDSISPRQLARFWLTERGQVDEATAQFIDAKSARVAAEQAKDLKAESKKLLAAAASSIPINDTDFVHMALILIEGMMSGAEKLGPKLLHQDIRNYAPPLLIAHEAREGQRAIQQLS